MLTIRWETTRGPRLWALHYQVHKSITNALSYETFHFQREDRGFEEELETKFVDGSESCAYGIERNPGGTVYYPPSIHEVSQCQIL